MKKSFILTALDHIAPHQPLLSGVKKFHTLIAAVLIIFLLGLLITSCEPIITNGTGTHQQVSSGGSTSPIDEGDFLINPRTATGPAIVEYWNGLSGADKVCGTFQLPTGESFNYKAGHWWRYKSDQDMQAEWPLHVALYQQKSENAGCSIGQRPPS